jgi:hypothetical protein
MKNLLRNSTKLGAGIALVCGVATQGCKRVHIVDPPPPPPEGACENPDVSLLRRAIEAKAHWVKSGGKWTIALNVEYEWRAAMMSFAGLKEDKIQVSGASIKTMDLRPYQLEFALTPIRGKPQVDLEFAARCEAKWMPLRLKLDLSRPHKRNADIPVELVK